MAKGKLQIDILGTSFSISANEESEYLEKMLGYYRRIVETVSQNGSLQNSLQTSILSGIMLCDELFKEKAKTAKFQNTFNGSRPDDEDEKIASRLIDKLDEVL